MWRTLKPGVMLRCGGGVCIILLFPPNPRTSLSLSQLALPLLFFRIPSPLPGSSTPCFPELFPLSMDIQLILPLAVCLVPVEKSLKTGLLLYVLG